MPAISGVQIIYGHSWDILADAINNFFYTNDTYEAVAVEYVEGRKTKDEDEKFKALITWRIPAEPQ